MQRADGYLTGGTHMLATRSTRVLERGTIKPSRAAIEYTYKFMLLDKDKDVIIKTKGYIKGTFAG